MKQQQARKVRFAILLTSSSLAAKAKSPLADAAGKSDRAALHWAAHLDHLEPRLRVKVGRHVKYAKPTPLANLHLTLLDKVGVHLDSFADSKGMVDELFEPLGI